MLPRLLAACSAGVHLLAFMSEDVLAALAAKLGSCRSLFRAEVRSVDKLLLRTLTAKPKP